MPGDDFLFEGPAIEVRQPIGTFWAASIPARVVLEATAPDPLRIVSDPKFRADSNEWRTAIKLVGNQRALVEERLDEVTKYIGTLDATFPNAIILSANSEIAAPTAKTGEKWRLTRTASGARLVIPRGCQQASVVDGQHRLYGFLQAPEERQREFELLCAIFFEMPAPMQAMVFATINTKQVPVRRNMALNLHGYNVDDVSRDEWEPDRLAVFMARRLNFDKSGPLHNRIKIEAEDAPSPEKLPGARRAISLVAIVDGVEWLVSWDPSGDAAFLKEGTARRKRPSLAAKSDKAPLRDWYVKMADLELYELLKTYLEVANETLWSKGTEGSMLVRSIGIRAVLSVLANAIDHFGVPRAAPKGTDVWLPALKDRASAILKRAALLDFSDSFFEASGRGSARITNVILAASNLLSVEDLPETDRDDYRRIIGGEMKS